jgi:3-phenylpropionate/cinnamic acid dioxygenase small subunit
MNFETMESSVVDAAIALIWSEAALLDAKKYDQWLELWSDKGLYIVPTDPECNDFESRLNYVFDGGAMRRKRAQRMTGGYSVFAVDSVIIVRTVSRFLTTSQSSTVVEISSAQILIAHKRKTDLIFAANLEHRIVFDDGGPRIDRKVVRLINGKEPINAIGFLL